jgi:hypothetical protein
LTAPGLRFTRVLLALSSLLILHSEASAHEAGTTRVSIAFDENRSYRIDIVTDASALAEKLEASAGRQLPMNAPPPLVERIVRSSDDVFRRRLKIQFDDVQSQPDVAYRVDPAVDATSVAGVTITMSGQVPTRSHRFTWSYGWTFTSYVLTLEDRDSETPVVQTLEGDQASAPFSLKPPPTRTDRVRTTLRSAVRYASAGWTAVLPHGIDHVMFVLGVYFLSRRAKSGICHLGAFMVASSLAAGLASFGLVGIPTRVLAPLVGLSIAYIAIENLVAAENATRRVPIIFGFGFLHGIGSTAAFSAAGLPRTGLTTAVLSFNLGLQAGIVSTAATAFLLVGWHYAGEEWYRNRIVLPASTLLGCTAVYWMIVRVSS